MALEVESQKLTAFITPLGLYKWKRVPDTIRTGFQNSAGNQLKIKGSKCNFLRERVSFLGPIISECGVEVDPEKVRVV